MFVRLRHVFVVAPLALFVASGCSEKFTAEDLPGRVVSIGPASFSEGALSVRVVTYDQEGDSLILVPEFATSGGFGAIAADQLLTPLVLPETGPRETLQSVVVWQVPAELADSPLEFRIRIDGQSVDSPVLGPVTPSALAATLPEVPIDLDASEPDVSDAGAEDAGETDGSGGSDTGGEDTTEPDAANDTDADGNDADGNDADENDAEADTQQDAAEDAGTGENDTAEDADTGENDGSGESDGSDETDGSGEGSGAQ